MEHKDIARLLKIAGLIALAGVLAVFYIYIPVRVAVEGRVAGIWGWAAGLGALGLPYLPAIGCYFAICARIARNKSFCEENVRSMTGIARLMALSALLWGAAAIVLFVLPEKSCAFAALGGVAGISPALARAFSLLACAAGIAVAMVAKMISLLLGRAAELQSDNDLTI